VTAFEEADPERFLHLRDLAAERRLGDPAARGSATEGELVGHGHDVLQLPKRERVRAGEHR
jgi:hypothetical protein